MAATRAITLSQLIALRKGVQSTTHSELSRLHHDVQKPALLTGLSRTYRRIRDEDPELPSETQRVQLNAAKALLAARDTLTRLFDVTAAIDWTNAVAGADVVVGETVLIKAAPVSYLLFLEKQLVDLRTFVAKLPVLDPAEEWHWDGNADAWASGKTTTVRTKKEMRNHLVSPATDKHPAQVTVYTEDVPAGFWDQIRFSGALEGTRVKTVLDRIGTLSDAVKMAREHANMVDAIEPKPAGAVFGYLLAH